MYEVWYTEEGISQAVLANSFDKAVQFAVEAELDDVMVFEYIVGPNGEIRNDFVYEMAAREKKKRKDAKIRESGNPWVVEIRHQYDEDRWGIVNQWPTEPAATGSSHLISEKLGADRVRVRELVAEE